MKRGFFVFIFASLFTMLNSQFYKNDKITVTDLSITEKKGDKTYKAWISGDSLKSNYDGVENTRLINRVSDKYPELSTGYPIIDMLYAMAIDEILLDINDKGFFVAGEKWNQAWTRDMSYAIYLSLASQFNEVSKESLKTRIFNGNILQDTGTGGSYPISTDRIIWAKAAYETALLSGDDAFYTEVYAVIKKAMLQDIDIVFDKELGLFKGEQSFLDWREQTYPRWMTPADIGESYAIGTNVIHYDALCILSTMAEKLNLPDDKSKWDEFRELSKNGINKNLWSENRKQWGSYLIGGRHKFLYEGYETLGTSLGIMSELKSGTEALNMIRKLKSGSFGHPVVAPQLSGIAPYHNDSVWPFVQGYRALAAAKTGDTATFAEELFTLVRSGALFLTFKENLVASTGDKNGTQINSDRQLWSVASYLGLVYRGLAGLNFTESGIKFTPIKPESFKATVRLKNFKYNKSTLDIEVQGTGSEVASIIFDGVAQAPDFVLPAKTEGQHTVVIVVKTGKNIENITPLYDSASKINVVETAAIKKENGKSILMWKGDENSEYIVYKNGTELSRVKKLMFDIEDSDFTEEYSIAEINENLPLLPGNRVLTENPKGIIICEVEKSKYAGGTISEKIKQKNVTPTSNAILSEDFNSFVFNGKKYLEKWGDKKEHFIEFSIRIKESGTYIADWRYQNGGPINTGEKCALKELSVNKEIQRIIYFPHMGNWREWAFNHPIVVKLEKGENTIRIYNTDKTLSQKDQYPVINIDLMRLRKIK